MVVGIIAVVADGFYTKAYMCVEKRRHTHYKVVPQPISIKKDSAVLVLGGRLVKAKGCTDCHGADLGGQIFVNDPMLGHLIAGNLTKGKGGLAKDHNSEDSDARSEARNTQRRNTTVIHAGS